MDIYEIAAQKAWQAVFARVKELLAEGKKPADISRMLGHKGRSAVTNWIGEKVTAEKAEFPDMLRYMGVLGLNPMDYIPNAPTIRRPGCNAPTDSVEGEALPTVPVLGSTGAGPDVELFDSEPESFIQVLPQYMLPGLAAFRVDGDSMEPTIKCGSYVGVIPFNGDIAEGGIYLVSIPPFGRLIKRLKMGENGGIDLVSDNKAYEKRTISYEGYDDVVLGRVAWVWQLF